MSVTISGSGQIVKQVVQGSLGGSIVSTNSTSFVTSGLTATITPTNASNKILITVALNEFFSTVAGTVARFTVYRNGSTNIAPSNPTAGKQAFGGQYQSSGQALSNCCTMVLDSPATTSATTYTVYFVSDGGNTIQINADSGYSYITLMEIAYA